MSKRSTFLLLHDMLDSILAIEEYLQGYTEDDFYRDRKTKDAVVRNFEVLGEAAGKISPEFKQNYPDIKWREVGDLRNRMIHEYFGIDYVIIWEIYMLNIPFLKEKVQELINNLPKE